MADDNKPTADQIQFALDLAKEKGKDYTKSKLQGMSGKEVSDAIDSMKKEETEASGKQVEFALDLLKEQGKSSPSKAQLDKMDGANISKLIDKLKGSDKKASQVAKTIMEQMGGRRGMMMIGAKNLKSLPRGLAFSWPNRQRSKGNYVEITLTGRDDYEMEFFNWAMSKGKKPVKKYRGIYAEDLIPTFQDQTGWRLRMATDKKSFAPQRKLMERLFLELQDWPHSTLKELHGYATSGRDSKRKPMNHMPVAEVKKALDELIELGAVVLRGRAYDAKGGRGIWKNKKAGMFNALDADQESLAEELFMMASNDGAAYKKRDADGAAKTAMRELRQSRLRDLDHDMKAAHKAVVKALKARWRQSDKEHRQNQRAASMNKQAVVQEAMKRAKADPEFRKKLVAAVQKKAKPGGGPVSKKDYDGFFKHLMAAYKIASKWEEQDKPGGYVANESLGAFMEKLKRDMKKHVK